MHVKRTHKRSAYLSPHRHTCQKTHTHTDTHTNTHTMPEMCVKRHDVHDEKSPCADFSGPSGCRSNKKNKHPKTTFHYGKRGPGNSRTGNCGSFVFWFVISIDLCACVRVCSRCMPRTMGCTAEVSAHPKNPDGAALPLGCATRGAGKRRQKPKPTAVKQQQTVGFFSRCSGCRLRPRYGT